MVSYWSTDDKVPIFLGISSYFPLRLHCSFYMFFFSSSASPSPQAFLDPTCSLLLGFASFPSSLVVPLSISFSFWSVFTSVVNFPTYYSIVANLASMFIDVASSYPRVVGGIRRTCEVYGDPINDATINIIFRTSLGQAPVTWVFILGLQIQRKYREMGALVETRESPILKSVSF